jgi:hypothetical protein
MFPLVGRTPAGSPLLDEAARGNRATLDSIHTFSCRITTVPVSASGKVGKPTQGEYWWSHDKVRGQWVDHGFTVDALASGSVSRSLTSHAHERQGSVMPNAGWLPPCDPRESALLTLTLFSDARPEVPFDELLRRGQQIGRVARNQEAGHECIVIELVDRDDVTREIWFEPRFNYMIWKTVYMRPGKSDGPGGVRTERVVTRFLEAAPSLFFPAQVEFKALVGGKVSEIKSTTFSDVHINEPLPPDIFDFRFPKDTVVFDRILGKTYVVDGNGNPVGEQKELPVAVAPPVRSAPGDITRTEPVRWSSWLLPCSVGALGGAAAIWGHRRWLESRPVTVK